MASRMPPGLLLDRQVPHVPGVRAVLPQYCLLDRGRRQPVTGHTKTLASIADILEEVERRFLAGLKAGGSTPRI
jgi:hypothetical protein